MDNQDLTLTLNPGDKVYMKTAYAGYIPREVKSIKRGIITLVCGTKFDRYGNQKDVPRWSNPDTLLTFEEGQKADLAFQINLLRQEKTSILESLEKICDRIAALEAKLKSLEDNP